MGACWTIQESNGTIRGDTGDGGSALDPTGFLLKLDRLGCVTGSHRIRPPKMPVDKDGHLRVRGSVRQSPEWYIST